MTVRLALATLVSVAASAAARQIPTPPTTLDWHPKVPRLLGSGGSAVAPTWDVAQGAVEQLGEIVILEGDAALVSDDGQGNTGILFTEFAQNPVEITKRFYTVYDDEFDELIIFTSFRDSGAPGALAYEVSTNRDVHGIGGDIIDQSLAWGAGKGALHAFVNMKEVAQYQRFDGQPITSPTSFFYPVMGQEFAHRWLSFMLFKDANGANSDAMLGRDKAHWSTVMDADASVMDGQHWVDNGDGTFRDAESGQRYSKLDLYGMGLLPASQVPPWFLIRDAVDAKSGARLDPASGFQIGTVAKGTREDITIDQVIAANGARKPTYEESPKQFRIAFVLVTRPGERAGDPATLALAQQLETVRRIWEDKFQQYSAGTGRVCTQVSAPCGAPVARVVGGTLTEGTGANGNGILEPGEPIVATFRIANDPGVGAAADVKVAATCGAASFATEPTVVPQLHTGETVEVAIPGTLGGDGALCGQLVTVEGQATTGGHSWRGFAQAPVGVRDAHRDTFLAGGGGWGANLDGSDTALVDAWEWGHPQPYSFYSYYTFQPDSGRDGKGGAWFTGLTRGNIFNGVFHGLPLGRATLWSPRVDLSTAIRPQLRYWAWFQALDTSVPNQAPVTADEDHLILEASADGVAWVKLDQVDGADDRWRPREVDLGGLALDKPVLFRFTVNRGTGMGDGESELVEAGISDFQVLTWTAACVPPTPDMTTTPNPVVSGGGCSCALGASGGGFGFAALTLVLFGFALRPRRRG